MAYVPATKDLSKIKTKAGLQSDEAPACLFFRRSGGGPPAYLLSRDSIGNSAAMFLMIGPMLPFFFWLCMSGTACH